MAWLKYNIFKKYKVAALRSLESRQGNPITSRCLPKCNYLSMPLSWCWFSYRQVSNIRRTLVGNKIVDNSDVGAAPTTSSLST